jgi:phage tail sheath protein FI
MAFQVSPGVNVSEIDLTTIVPAVATSLAGIASTFEWGPSNQVVLVDTPKTFREIFGDVKEYNYEQYFTALNFLGYSRGLQVVRVDADGQGQTANNACSSEIPEGQKVYIPNDEVPATELSSQSFIARYPGSKGNSLSVSVASHKALGPGDWEYFGQFGRPASSTDNLLQLSGLQETNDQVHIVVIDAGGKFTGARGTVLERFESVSLHPKARNNNGSSNFFKNVINESSKYIRCGGKIDSYDLGVSGSFFGSGADKLNVSGITNFNEDYEFTVGATFATVVLDGGEGETYTLSNPDLTGLVPQGKEGVGYNLFSDSEKFDVNLILSGGINETGELQALKNIAEDRKDCISFFTCDVGKGGKDLSSTDSEKSEKCIAFKNKIGSSSYVVIDSGYKKQFDPYNQIARWVPMNGDIAGLVAKTEFDRDAWFSPAGYNRGILRAPEALAFNPNRTFRDRIYPKGINPVIFEKETGYLLLGDRTGLSKPSAFDRINVRRLFIVLEKAIATASKYSLFEFNDDFTRARFVALVQPFLSDVQARRGIIDFKVVCDESNNTPERIDRNEFWADIYIKPNRTINYIQLNFIATRTDANFTELGG